MKKIGKININSKIIISILIIIIVILLVVYGILISRFIKKRIFAKDMTEISEKNANPIFSIEKIYLCSSANAIDNSAQKNLQDLSLYQYTDIAIYINNNYNLEDTTNENTISELYIDNISLEGTSDIGEKRLFYTNALDFGKGISENIVENNDRIDFNIVYTNSENENADYSKPTFYTDCSNPITLKYINQNIVTGYKMNEDTSVSFDGKILEKAGVSINDIGCKISFKINIVNNNKEHFSSWINFSIPLSDLYKEGTTMKSATTTGVKYEFFQS